ncbi:hypothetical protein ROLI_030240 [Roseobacter fucihabitans]|uniref:Uncharacterized protein n=1 Tax=Roseobacter fucihabitans TaxID=1537242 RepID=A0ABZ2BYY6_9RHOB|nr:hypothetical protein [Roseobacter litoralis]MBC6967900.1 hypothetical protein [Roseobacter litoralis]MBC6968076.1 hypothetical protein [Roseobacter litoralis]
MNRMQFCFSFDSLKRLGINYDYDVLITLEKQGEFPKQVESKIWDAKQVLEWHLANIDKLPTKHSID